MQRFPEPETRAIEPTKTHGKPTTSEAYRHNQKRNKWYVRESPRNESEKKRSEWRRCNLQEPAGGVWGIIRGCNDGLRPPHQVESGVSSSKDHAVYALLLWPPRVLLQLALTPSRQRFARMHAIPIVPEGPHECGEQPVDVMRRPGASLQKVASQLPCELGAFLSGDLPFLGLVTFVPDEDVGGVRALYADHGLAEDFETVKGGAGGDGIDEDEALSFADPLVSECSVFLLTCGIDHFNKAELIVDDILFSISVFDRRVIRLDEDTQHVLYSEGGLSNASVAQNCDSPIVHGPGRRGWRHSVECAA